MTPTPTPTPVTCDPSTPVYEIPSGTYTAEQIISVLLDPIDESKVCCKRPTDIRGSATFVIDLDKLEHPDDARKDNFGRWIHSGSHTTPFKAWLNEIGDVEFKRVDKEDAGVNVQYLRRINSYHPSDHTCKRLLGFITGM